MSLTPAKMHNSLKEQLLQEERDIKASQEALAAEEEAVKKAKPRAAKND